MTEQWKKDVQKLVKNHDDAALLNATVELAAGDDYDGGMTAAGVYEFSILRKELAKRLKKLGFLKKGINKYFDTFE